MAKVAGLGGKTYMANDDIFQSLGSILSSLYGQNNLKKFWVIFKGIRVTLWELVWHWEGASMSALVPGQTRGFFQIRWVKDGWRKIPKGWGIKYPVITPKWCMFFSNLLLPWVSLSYHCKLTQDKSWSLGSLDENHEVCRMMSYKPWWCPDLADWLARI